LNELPLYVYLGTQMAAPEHLVGLVCYVVTRKTT